MDSITNKKIEEFVFLDKIAKELREKEELENIKEKGKFEEFCKKIKESFERCLKNEVNEEDKIGIKNFEDNVDYSFNYIDFLIKDWDTAKTHKLDLLISKIIKNLKIYISDKGSKFILIEDGKDTLINNQKFKSEFIDFYKNDDVCFYVSFSDLSREVINEEGNMSVKVSSRYIFTVWSIYE